VFVCSLDRQQAHATVHPTKLPCAQSSSPTKPPILVRFGRDTRLSGFGDDLKRPQASLADRDLRQWSVDLYPRWPVRSGATSFRRLKTKPETIPYAREMSLRLANRGAVDLETS
jgi:hypothetical protein